MFIAIMYENGYHGPMLTDQGGKKASWQNCIYSSASFVLAKPVRINPASTSLKLKYSIPPPPETFLKNLPQATSKSTVFWNQELSPHSMNLCSDYLSEI